MIDDRRETLSVMKLSDLFNAKGNSAPDARHALIIDFSYGHESLDPLHALESKLRLLLYNTGLGELDGHEIAMDSSDGSLYLYGPNAEQLFKAIRPLLLETPWMRKAGVYLRFGGLHDEGAAEIDFILE